MSTGEKVILFPDRGNPCSHLFLSDQQYTSNFIMQKWMRGRYNDSLAYAKQRAKKLRSVPVCQHCVQYILYGNPWRHSKRLEDTGKIVSVSGERSLYFKEWSLKNHRERNFSARIVFYSQYRRKTSSLHSRVKLHATKDFEDPPRLYTLIALKFFIHSAKS